MVKRFRSGAGVVQQQTSGRVFRGAPVKKSAPVLAQSPDITLQKQQVQQDLDKVDEGLREVEVLERANQFGGDGAIISRRRFRELQVRRAELGARRTVLVDAQRTLEQGRVFSNLSDVDQASQEAVSLARRRQGEKLEPLRREVQQTTTLTSREPSVEERADGSFVITDSRGNVQAFDKQGREIPLQSTAEGIVEARARESPIDRIVRRAQAKEAEQFQSRADTFADPSRFISPIQGTTLSSTIKGRFQQVGVGVIKQTIITTEGLIGFGAQLSVRDPTAPKQNVDFSRLNNQFGQFVRDIKATPISRTAGALSFAAVQGSIIIPAAVGVVRGTAGVVRSGEIVRSPQTVAFRAGATLSPLKARNLIVTKTTAVRGFDPKASNVLDAVNVKAKDAVLSVQTVGKPRLTVVESQGKRFAVGQRDFKIKQFTNVVRVQSSQVSFKSFDTSKFGSIKILSPVKVSGEQVKLQRISELRGKELTFKKGQITTENFVQTAQERLTITSKLTPLGDTQKFSLPRPIATGKPSNIVEVSSRVKIEGFKTQEFDVKSFVNIGGVRDVKSFNLEGVVVPKKAIVSASLSRATVQSGGLIEQTRIPTKFVQVGRQLGDGISISGKAAPVSPALDVGGGSPFQKIFSASTSPALTSFQAPVSAPLATKTLTSVGLASTLRTQQRQQTIQTQTLTPTQIVSTKTLQTPTTQQTQTTVQTTVQKSIQAQTPIQAQRALQTQVPAQITPTVTTPTTIIPASPPPTPPTTFIPFKLPQARAPTKVFKSMFPVFVRRGGVFRPVGSGRTPQQAVGIGARIARTTLAATFAVGNIQGNLRTPRGFKQTSRGGRTLFVEQPKLRLNTPKELIQIQTAKRRKKKK